jgi:hypothetical protein
VDGEAVSAPGFCETCGAPHDLDYDEDQGWAMPYCANEGDCEVPGCTEKTHDRCGECDEWYCAVHVRTHECAPA